MARAQQTAGDRHLLQLDQVFARPHPLVETQVNTRERHPEIEIEGAAHPHQFVVEGNRLQLGLQSSIHIDKERHRHGKLLLLPQLAPRLAARFWLAAGSWGPGPCASTAGRS